MKTNTSGILTAFVITLFAGCVQKGTDLPFIIPRHDKESLSGTVVRALCYFDVDRYNPLNALDYTLSDGSGFFDFVALGSAELKKDGRWVYIDIPPALKYVLENRYTYVLPFQRKGIKVLLGITGGKDGVSFGSITKDDTDFLAVCVKDIVEQYGLDGVEIYDAGGAKSPSVGNFPYPEGIFTDENGRETQVDRFPGDPDGKLEAWRNGGDMMNNFIWRLRKHLGDWDDFPIIVREENHGRYLPAWVSGADFTGRNDQLNYTVNPDFAIFGKSYNTALYHNMYAPLAINLDGDAAAGAVVPPLTETGGIFDFSRRFAETGDYPLIYCRNLKPVSQASGEPYLDVPPEAQALAGGKTRLTQAEYLSITARAVFGKDVICGGGDNRVNW